MGRFRNIFWICEVCQEPVDLSNRTDYGKAEPVICAKCLEENDEVQELNFDH
jgi:hypothetical protein